MSKRKPVTISLKSDLHDRYKKYCEEQGMFLSRRIEKLMERDLEQNRKKEIII